MLKLKVALVALLAVLGLSVGGLPTSAGAQSQYTSPAFGAAVAPSSGGGGVVSNSAFTNAACQGVQSIDTNGCNGNEGASLGKILKLVINILSMVVGFAAVVMVIFGAFKYITAAGDSNKLANARTTIVYALIGALIVAVAQVLVRFVLTKANN